MREGRERGSGGQGEGWRGQGEGEAQGQLSVDPTFRRLGVRRAVVHRLEPLVAFDGHRLHLQSRSIPWEGRGIINCAFVGSLGVLMVLCDDWKLYVYNRNLELIGRLSDWESKYSVGFEYIESLGLFLLVGVIEIETLKVALRTNLKETKFLSSVRFGIERLELRAVEEKNRLSWNKGYGYDLGEGLLYVWGTQGINFYSLPRLELRSAVPKLVKKETAITYVHFNSSYKYTITGLINGNVKVWRLPLSTVSSAECIMIHNCNHHTKQVDKIVPSSDDRVIISAANDLTICLWSLETFELLRVYNFESEYSSLALVDHRRAYATQNGELGELTFGKTMEFIAEIDSNIAFFDKWTADGRVRAVQVTLESNVGLQIAADELKKKDLNKIDVGWFYPPLKAQAIKQVLSCPYDSALYYMLVENGELFSLKMEAASSRIEESFSLQHTQDSENHPLNQLPTFLAFFPLPDIRFDSEITENSLTARKNDPAPRDPHAAAHLKLLTIGCSRGSIVVVSLECMERMRARLTYHRESITNLQLVAQGERQVLVSHCAEDYLRFIALEHDKANCFLTIACGHALLFSRSFEDKLALVFRKGIFEVAQITAPAELKITQNLDAIDHEGEILALDYEAGSRLIMTSGSDNRIKIWSLRKVLVFEIKLDEGLKYAIWSNDLEILVLHRNKLLYLRHMRIDQHHSQQEAEEDDPRKYAQLDIKEKFQLLRKESVKRRADREQEREKEDSFLEATFQRRKALSQVGAKPDVLPTPTRNPRGASSKPKSKKHSATQNYSMSQRAEEEQRRRAQLQVNARAARRHMEEMGELRAKVNQSLLPKIQPRSEDKFEEFINAKLISKKMLTRRDITLNRIIMKNLIKQQFAQDDDHASLKLDF